MRKSSSFAALRSLTLATLVAGSLQAQQNQAGLELARAGRTNYTILLETTDDAGKLAANELASYFKRMSAATFNVASKTSSKRVIALRVATESVSDGYTITVRGDSLLLTGNSPRALLFASYDLLTRLGCRFIAPELSFYGGDAEYVPRAPALMYRGARTVTERPIFATRKINIEEGLSHDLPSMRAIVAWMPKARFNTISIPMDYGGTGRVKWDNWRADLTSDLEQRGIDIEVGGHGYQNFLNASMEQGNLFAQRSDWFGRDSTCQPSRGAQYVFNTGSPQAVAFVGTQVANYVKQRSEINILEFWPPDGARWAACGPSFAETIPDRHATLLNRISDVLRQTRADLRLQAIAYGEAEAAPKVLLDRNIMIDVCPIAQNFDFQIDDPRGVNNAKYVALIRDWRKSFGGHLALYSYFRRYAWISLPVLLPHYMQHDMQWYAGVPMQGMSTYAEPADWFTYELNHYVFGQLAWNADVALDALIADYMKVRYGHHAQMATTVYGAMEDVVRKFGSVQNSSLRTADEIQAARARIDMSRLMVDSARMRRSTKELDRLALMLEFASRDLEIQHARASGVVEEARPIIEELNRFLLDNAERGVFLTTGSGNRARVVRHYGMRAYQ